MYQIEYAALKYYNNIISEECLYIGMLFHNLSTGKKEFRHINNFKRFQVFDDEADVDFIKLYLEGIRQEIAVNDDERFSVAEFSKRYVNEMKFTSPVRIDVDEGENYIDNLTKIFMKFDFKQEKRLSQADERKYIRRILASTNIEFSSSKVSGVYEESVNFDYIIGNVAIKLFSFKEKDGGRIIPSAKQWAFSAEELKDRYRVVFLYDESDNTPNMEIVMKILKKHGMVYQINEGLDYVLESISQYA